MAYNGDDIDGCDGGDGCGGVLVAEQEREDICGQETRGNGEINVDGSAWEVGGQIQKTIR